MFVGKDHALPVDRNDDDVFFPRRRRRHDLPLRP